MSSEKKNNKATAKHYQNLAKQAKAQKAKGEGVVSKIIRKITGK